MPQSSNWSGHKIFSLKKPVQIRSGVIFDMLDINCIIRVKELSVNYGNRENAFKIASKEYNVSKNSLFRYFKKYKVIWKFIKYPKIVELKCKQCNKVFYNDPYSDKLRECCSTSCRCKHSSECNKEIRIEKIKKWIFDNVTLGSKTDIILCRCEICDKLFYRKKKEAKPYCSSESCVLKYYIKHKHLKFGGYRNGSGVGKRGWYKGYRCDSSWELAYVIYNLDHNIKFKRNTKGYPYFYKNKKFLYYPDFLENDVFVEIKGYSSDQWKCKYDYFSKDHNIKIIDEKEIKQYLNYVVSKYGKNYTNLYEKTCLVIDFASGS